MVSLEQRLLNRKLRKPDWREWIPLYGVYQVKKDLGEGSFFPPDHPTRFMVLAVYQGLSGAATIMGGSAAIYGISELLQKLF